MKKENVMASLWISATAALVVIGYACSYLFTAFRMLGSSGIKFTTLLLLIGSALLLIAGIYLIEETVKLVFKLKKDENYLADHKGKQLIILILQGALVLGGLMASIIFIEEMFGIGLEYFMIYAGQYSVIPLAFVAHTIAFVLHLVTMIKAKKVAKVEVVEPTQTAE